jgi:hypothetical protein
MTLGEIPTGARVVKTNARPVDAAFGGIGTVHREDDMVGVEWPAWPGRIVQYSPDSDEFEVLTLIHKAGEGCD